MWNIFIPETYFIFSLKHFRCNEKIQFTSVTNDALRTNGSINHALLNFDDDFVFATIN